MKALFHRCILFLFTATALVTLSAAHAEVDLAKSSIAATVKQMNVPIEGSFRKFKAQVNFDPARPASGSAQITVDIGSYDLGDAAYDSQVTGKEWFDAKAYPTAMFVSSSIAPAGGTEYRVTGKLTIKGKSEIVVVPVTVVQRSNTLVFDGALPIKRSNFDIGTGEWKSASIVADDVVIKFHIISAKL